MSNVFDSAFDRFTGSLAEGGAKEIPLHEDWIEVPAGICAPGVFVDEEGAEHGFWLLLREHTVRRTQSIMQRTMGKRGEVRVDQGTAMIRDAIVGVSDREGGDLRNLRKVEREWLWKALSTKGRNLVSSKFDRLTEPLGDEDESGNDPS